MIGIKDVIESFADMIAINPHSPVFPKEDNYAFVVE